MATTTTDDSNVNRGESETRSTTSSSLYLQNAEELKRIFDQFDSNGDGKISVTELGAVLHSMGGSTYTDKELRRVMDDVDSDKDGFINLDEFTQLCRSSSSASSDAAELRDAFDLYDENRDGLISSVELHKVLNRLGMKCSVEECVKMIKTVDSDGDGSVDFGEFKKMMASTSGDNVAGSQ